MHSCLYAAVVAKAHTKSLNHNYQMKNDQRIFDVLIIGAGLVGNSLALAIADFAKTAIIEANPLNVKSLLDERALALSAATRRILTALDVWKMIQPHSTPISQVHVSESGHFGATRFSAADYGMDALGYTVTAHTLTEILKQSVLNKSAIESFYSSRVEQITPVPDGYRVQVQTQKGMQIFTTRLLIGADGAQSPTRKLLGIASKQEDYAQTALTACMTLTRAHRNIAYERFAEDAVLAALPMIDNRAVIVWTIKTTYAKELEKLTNTDFCSRFQAAFGYRLGRFIQVEKRLAYPVRGLRALEQIRPHAVLIGNAAHTLHPVAAQGFNLSLRDVAVLVQVIMDALAARENPGHLSQLEKYLHQREKKQLETMAMTEGVINSFSKKTLPWKLLKKSGFLGLEIFPAAKNVFAKHAMGVAEEVPKWVSEKFL